MTVYLTSDLHLGHARAAGHRGFADVESHDQAIVDNWNTVVAADDVVWVLGDLAASSPTYALELLGTLPGRKHLILGNHEPAHPMHRDAHKHLRKYLNVFESVASAARRRIGGREVLLSHFPYRRDRGPARHLQWRLRDEGLWLLHGHTHGAERVTASEREVHVGVDAWDLAPVSVEIVGALIEAEETRKQANRQLRTAFRGES
jgi:calcineurin-like phosphoesterase family protein